MGETSMLTRDEMIEKVDVLYEGRRTGDQSRFGEVLAQDATFRFVGEASLVAMFPGHGSQEPSVVAQALFDSLVLHDKRMANAVAQGNQLAVHYVLTLQNETKGGTRFDQEVFDLWTFNEAGEIASGLQFQDTAKIIEEL
jgi:ketosteroid isomerase-like protein